MKKTATHRLIEVQMGGSLKRYVRRRRNAERSWRGIADEIEQQTGVKVTDASLRNWFKDIA